ncbi:2-alkenal reductase, putative [Entamoeba invadens IP1]|uniref:2-alkenal reductase, putative n=1 Tax=Entamoeba invadens IP1 TaxID=370355 RepID=UPI0002C3DEF1|nr:2-alkenal reductase, putative [Entamoeba invadens IP1]ELP90384.1 2-alkenal reductase, putative [Entamoeba invadens IP1]|eukprot:XP_004257155.1 2-alkenal reductase, putative [Entamoeba invadens IP1]
MSTPTPDKKQPEQAMGPAQVQALNLQTLQGFYPHIESIAMNCGVVSVYEISAQTHDPDCRGPLFLVQTREKEMWMIVLNQLGFGTYRISIDENTQFQEQDRYVTLKNDGDNVLVQFCFVSQNAEDEREKAVKKLKNELRAVGKASTLLKHAVAYCSK